MAAAPGAAIRVGVPAPTCGAVEAEPHKPSQPFKPSHTRSRPDHHRQVPAADVSSSAPLYVSELLRAALHTDRQIVRNRHSRPMQRLCVNDSRAEAPG